MEIRSYLPILYDLSMEARKKSRLNRVVLLVIQHLLSDAVDFQKACLAAGCPPEDMFVVGVPYSTKDHVVNELRSELGVAVEAPGSGEMEHAAERMLERALERCRQARKRLVIVEDGGHVVPLLHRRQRADWCDMVLGAVEQTRYGIHLDSRLAAKNSLAIPVISIPDCELKRSFEPPFIADAVFRSLCNILQELRLTPRGRRVTVVGFGALGSCVARVLRENHLEVAVWDMDPAKRAAASAYFQCPPLDEALRRADIIIGAGGNPVRPSIDRSHLAYLPEGVLLTSVSSRQGEFDVKAIERDSRSRWPMPNVGTGYLTSRGRELYLAADGYPINFFQSDSAGKDAMDVIQSLMFDGVLCLASGRRVREPGIYSAAKVLRERDIAQKWHEELSVRQGVAYLYRTSRASLG